MVAVEITIGMVQRAGPSKIGLTKGPVQGRAKFGGSVGNCAENYPDSGAFLSFRFHNFATN